jgi:hypothetical protein
MSIPFANDFFNNKKSHFELDASVNFISNLTLLAAFSELDLIFNLQ